MRDCANHELRTTLGPTTQPQASRTFFALCGLVLVADTILLSVFNPLLPHFSAEFALSGAQAGIVVAAFPAGGALAALPAGRLPDRIGAKATLLVGLAVLVVASGWFALLSSSWELVVTRCLQGIGSTITWIGTFVWLVSRSETHRRGEIIGRGYGIAMAGSLIGPSLAIAVVSVGELPTFGALAALFLVLLVVFAGVPDFASSQVRSKARARDLIRSNRALMGFWLLALQSLVLGGLAVLAPLRLADLGFSTGGISIVYVTSAALVLSVMPVVGRWSDRRGRRRPITLMLAGAFAATSLLPWISNAWTFAAVFVLAELFLFGLSAPVSAFVTDAVEAENLGLGMGWAVILLAWAPAGMVGALVAGGLRDTAEHLPYLIMVALCVGTLLLVHEPRVKALLN